MIEFVDPATLLLAPVPIHNRKGGVIRKITIKYPRSYVPMAVYGFQHSMGYYMDIAPTPSLDPKRKQVTQSPLLW